jgi:hypothetical protein
MRNVKGVLFADYIRMIRSFKGVDWTRFLRIEDIDYLRKHIRPDDWYPMASFERLGDAILAVIAHGDLDAVRRWGWQSVDQLAAAYPMLVAREDPVETLSRFRVLRSTFFDFDALQIPLLHENEARVVIAYHMGQPAEEAAAHQTLGFFERLLELSGAFDAHGHFLERSWAGDERTLLELTWAMEPGRGAKSP